MPDIALDRDLTTQVAAAVRLGEWPERALVRLGVLGPDVQRWLQRGSQALQEGADPDADEYAHLVRAIDVAESDCEHTWHLAAVAAAHAGRNGTGRDSHRSAAKAQDFVMLLERRFPERWCVRGTYAGRKGKENESMEEALARLTKEQ